MVGGIIRCPGFVVMPQTIGVTRVGVLLKISAYRMGWSKGFCRPSTWEGKFRRPMSLVAGRTLISPNISVPFQGRARNLVRYLVSLGIVSASFGDEERLLWVNSPVPFLGRVVRKLIAERSRAIVVVPVCPAVWWYQELEVWSCRSVHVPILGYGGHGVGSRHPYPDTIGLGCEFGRDGSGTRAFLLAGVPGGFLTWVTEEPGAAEVHLFDGPWNGRVRSIYSHV